MDWTIQELGAIGEFVGAIAVVATLFYLTIQVRQNKRSTDANTRSITARASWDAGMVFALRNERISRDPEFAALLQRATDPAADIEDFDAAERAQIMFDTLSTLLSFQAQYFLWREGSLPDDVWEQARVWVAGYTERSIITPFWEQFGMTYLLSPDFVNYVESTRN